MLLRILRWPVAITVLAVIAVTIFAGPAVGAAVAILAILEISLSFDNAVVNAKILNRMSPLWQRLFLTVGILIAVFGMRLVFPIAIVAIAAHLSPAAVWNMALHDPAAYATHLTAAHGVIAGFGGMFLLMLFMNWLFEERDIKWLPFERWLTNEKLMGRWEGLLTLPRLIAALVLTLFGTIFPHEVAYAGLAGWLVFEGVTWLSNRFEGKEDVIGAVGTAGFFSFLYLEVLDASFSFDGVIGAFAISNQILVIALGLGLGALFVRSLTVYLVRSGKLTEYRYLEHGAHYAIGALAVLLFVSINHEIPELITGLIGVGFIAAAFIHSVRANKGESEWLLTKNATSSE